MESRFKGAVFVFALLLLSVSAWAGTECNYLAACTSFPNQVFTAQVWTGTVTSFADVSTTAPANYFSYDSGLFMQPTTQVDQVGSMNFVVWNLLQNVSSEPYSFVWLPNPVVTLPIGYGGGGQPLPGTPVPTPEPAALALFATGLLGGIKVLRSRFSA